MTNAELRIQTIQLAMFFDPLFVFLFIIRYIRTIDRAQSRLQDPEIKRKETLLNQAEDCIKSLDRPHEQQMRCQP